MRTTLVPLLALAAGCLGVAVALQEGPRGEGEAALRDRDWAKAERLLGEALAAATAGRDEVLYLLAVAQAEGGKPDAALATIERILGEHPASPLRMKAVFKKADVLAAKKDFENAAVFYEGQLGAITDPARRKRLAMVYVSTGREFLHPKDPKDPTFVPDYKVAHGLLSKSLELEALGTDEEGVRADLVRCELEGKLGHDALLASCSAFEEKFPRSPKLDEILFARGTALAGLKRPWEAEKAWTRVAAEFPASKRAPEGLLHASRLYAPAASVESLRRQLRILRRIVRDFAASEEAAAAAYGIGQALKSHEDLREDARREFAAFAEARPRHELAPSALLEVAQLHRADRDDAKALAAYEDFLRRFPDSPHWPQVRQQIADLRFERIQRAAGRKDGPGVRAAAQEFVSAHAADPRAAQAEAQAAASLKEEKKFREAVEAFLKVAAKYPAFVDSHQARYAAAEILSLELDDFETALKELQKVGGGSAALAAALTQRLQSPALSIRGERVFRGGENPAVAMSVRNLETVKFRLWTLDLKDYFEKKSSTAGLQDLEVSVIAPDQEWEFKVPDYRRFKEFKLPVELPKKDAGAYVITAASGALEAKTVVVVSDLALIARAGRKGATVIVQNLRTGERVENATLSTAADGKPLKAWTPETNVRSLSFLAEAGGHFAFRDVATGQAAPPERTPIAQILADRRVYGPEDEVRLRVVLRDVVENGFAVPKEKKYRLAASTTKGALFFEADLAPSATGLASASFRLLPGLRDGITVAVWERAKPQEKLLGELKLPIGAPTARRRHFDFIADDAAVFAGDPVDVAVVLRDAWGRPMPGRRVRVRTADAPEGREVRTGPDGTFAVRLEETERFVFPGFAEIVAEDEGVADALRIPVFARLPVVVFDEGSRLLEPVVAGEAKTLAFTARRLDEAPVSAAFRWTVVRENEVGERFPLASGEATTGANGKGSLTFTPAEGGLHLVAVSTRDAEGIPVRAQVGVRAIDDREEQKLRLLSVADEFEAGKPMEFQVLSRLERGLAFVTVESERVEQVVAVTLEKGRNALRLAAPPSATDDFTVAVMMMQGNAFHADLRDFRVKAPEVKVEPSKKEYRPGEEAVVTVTARPGSEVVLVAGDRGADAAFNPDVLRALRRGIYFAGDSSVATSFAGVTAQIDEQVLNALARLEALNRAEGARVMMPTELPEDPSIVRAGEGGGQYGARMGGRRNLVARGGGGGGGGRMGPGIVLAEPAPLFFGSAEADAAGVATFRFRMPHEWEDVMLVASAVDATNALGRKVEKVKVRAPVTAEFRLPETAVEGEKTSAVALLTNRSRQEQELTLAFGGEARVKVPARSTLEKTFEWTAGKSAVFSLDGIAREEKVRLRPRAPTTHNESGGAYAARAELRLDGEGKHVVRVATGPEALLESLGADHDEWAPASSSAARLLAAVARHRYAKWEGARRALLEYAALRAQGFQDAAVEDESWPVLVYLAAAEAKAAELDVVPDGTLLRERFARASHDDLKALQLFALARGGEAQYGYVHRLWRAADTLAPRALASVALSLKALSKPDEAKEAVARLARAVRDDHWEPAEVPVPDASNTAYAVTALAAFALAEIEPAHALLPRARAWLLARSPSAPFERAMLALAMQATPDKSQVTELKVGGQVVRGFGEVAVEDPVVEPTGQGTFYALARRATGRAPEPPVRVAVKRTNRWPALVVDGERVRYESRPEGGAPENPSMARVAAGETFAVEFEVTVSGPTTRYHLLRFPEVTGLRGAGRTLLLHPQKESESKRSVVVQAYADLPGAYPEIEVLAAGAPYREGWSMTRDERLGAGRIHFAGKRWAEARDALLPLFDRISLTDAAVVEAARMLAYSAVELRDHGTVVRAFEVLKEKAPAEVVPFDKTRAVGRAYAAVREHERAMQVYSGTCDAYFLQEANVVGTLEELGRTKPATEEMKRLLLDHPDSALNREMLFGLGLRLTSTGRAMAAGPAKDSHKLTRAETLAEAAAVLGRHLAWYPKDEAGDRVALTLGSAHLEAGRHAEAERAARAAAARHPKSRFLDGFDYSLAYSLFAQKKFADALAMCDRLETFDYGANANPGPAVMRERGILMKAQIFHAQGILDRALENYKKVKDASPDAAWSVAFLEREAIAVPDVTVAPLGRPAEVELEYAGVAEAQLRAYKVDLTVLALRRKGVPDAASVEVAGIKPVFERAYALDVPNARRRERQKLALDLGAPGAYLVGVKAGGFFASGLVLRSDLAMTVQEGAEGTVRVNVTNAALGAFAEGVKVTAFGTASGTIATDKTDLRGVWETSGVRGNAIVVAEKDGHVALYRGQQALAVQPQGQRMPAPVQEQQKQQVDVLNEQVDEANKQLQEFYWHNNMRQQRGVEVERTKK